MQLRCWALFFFRSAWILNPSEMGNVRVQDVLAPLRRFGSVDTHHLVCYVVRLLELSLAFAYPCPGYPFMNTLKAICNPRPSVFDSSKRDTVLDLTDLADFIAERADATIKPAEFFEENEITEGMHTLLFEGFRRLEGKSSQGVFNLTQAMGGGKTHSMLVFGLLAHEPSLRTRSWAKSTSPRASGKFGSSPSPGGKATPLWGSGARSPSNSVRGNSFVTITHPFRPPDRKLGSISSKVSRRSSCSMSLSFYFVAAKSKMIGNSDLAQVTAIALSNLLVAVGKSELSQVCVVVSDLTGSYAEGSSQIASVLQDFTKETGRSAMSLEPVRINTDEFYKILRKRIFSKLPLEDEIAAVAQDTPRPSVTRGRWISRTSLPKNLLSTSNRLTHFTQPSGTSMPGSVRTRGSNRPVP